jgi:hypothetical protein
MTTDRHHINRLPPWGPRALWAEPFVALTILMTLAVACSGGSRSPGVADVDSTSTPDASPDDSTEPSGLAFAQCMREHGISNFPDSASEGYDHDPSALGLDPNSPTFKAAEDACKKYLPNGGQPPSPNPEREESGLLFSQCMRDQGFSNFPDPDSEGDIDKAPGIDPTSPQFQAAEEAWTKLLSGGGGEDSTDQSGGGE